MNESSCIGCKYLYSKGYGYSNYTWDETEIKCALELNKNLPAEEPCDWKKHPDNWPKTNSSRCVKYSKGSYVELDVDGEWRPEDYTDDEEVIALICKIEGIAPHGYEPTG